MAIQAIRRRFDSVIQGLTEWARSREGAKSYATSGINPVGRGALPSLAGKHGMAERQGLPRLWLQALDRDSWPRHGQAPCAAGSLPMLQR